MLVEVCAEQCNAMSLEYAIRNGYQEASNIQS